MEKRNIDAGACMNAAEQAIDQGKYAVALRLYARAAALDPDSWRVHDRRGRLESSCGLAAEAARSARRAMSAVRRAARGNPASAELRVEAASVLENHGAYDAASEHYRRAVGLGAEAADVLLNAARLSLWRGGRARAVVLADRALAADRDLGPARRIRGAAFVLRRRYPEALSELDQALAIDPNDSESYLWRGEARRLMGRHSLAMKDLETALALQRGWGDSLAALINRALSRLARGQALSRDEIDRLRLWIPRHAADVSGAGPRPRPERLARLLERALKRMSGNRSRVVTFLRSGRLARHEPADPRGPGGLYARIQKKCLLGAPGEAVEEFDRLVKTGRATPRLYAYRGEVRLWTGDYSRAVDDFNRALRLDGELPWPPIGLAGAFILGGRHEAALASLERAAKNGADPQRLWVRRGEALLRLGDPRAALADLEKATRTLMFIPSAWLLRALAEAAAGNFEGQRGIFARLRQSAASFMAAAAEEAGRPEIPDPERWTDASIGRTLEHALLMMRGNRSSSVYTYISRGGEMRAIRVKA